MERYRVAELSVGDAGLTARPAVYDTVARVTVKVYRRNEAQLAEDHVARLNAEKAVACPDCRTGTIPEHGRCGNCGLSWDDLEAAAEFLDRAEAGR